MRDRLKKNAKVLGVELNSGQLAQFERYFALLKQWNARINLTALESEEEIVDGHFVDSLGALAVLGDGKTLIDVGSGAGFPGAVLAIARPDLTVTCVDSVQKKVGFLQTLRREVVAIEPICSRAELIGRRFDIAISRAALPPERWLKLGRDLIVPSGRVIVMLAAAPDSTALQSVHYPVGDATHWAAAFGAADSTAPAGAVP